jgi:PAS domain S-box-containing protein/putative nucleotidyltransferase with HDIG domain
MDTLLRLLIIEDSARDVALEVRALEAAGYHVIHTIAETADKMKAALAEKVFDIIISDHSMPQFDTHGALAVLKQSGLDIPFIVVSGTIGEEMAVALMKAGAHDYVMKDRLSRLASAVENALKDVESRRERNQAEEALRKSEAQYRLLSEHTTDFVWLMDMNLEPIYQSPSAEKLSGFTRQELMELPFEKRLTSESVQLAAEIFLKELPLVEADPDYNPIRIVELELYRKDGTTMWAENKLSVIRDASGKPVSILGEARDITERKLTEEKLEKSYESLKKTLNDTINTMVMIVEMRDPYTAGHQRRVADLATAIAGEMKLEDAIVDQIRTAAVIHDIGKMYIPSDILCRPGKLSDMEFDLIKPHAQSGYDIVKNIDFPCNVAEAILQHHERADGSGYPNGLKSKDTLLEAKIIAVSDVVEAMSSHRPYRSAPGIDKALEEISKHRDVLYDPVVVDACLHLFNSGMFGFQPGDIRPQHTSSIDTVLVASH